MNVDRIQLKAINDRIYRSAARKPFFQHLLDYAKKTIIGDSREIRNLMVGMLGTAIWYIAHYAPYAQWKSQAEVSLYLLGGFRLNLHKFYALVKRECKKEIKACFYVDTLYQMDYDIDLIEEDVNGILGNDCMEDIQNFDEEYDLLDDDNVLIQDEVNTIFNNEYREIHPEDEDDEHDPLNGRYVNAEHEELLLAHDKACKENNQSEQDRIFKEELALFKREAQKETPLAMFYLGVCYGKGNGVEKNMSKAKELLTKAKMAGVKRADDFLFYFFEDLGED